MGHFLGAKKIIFFIRDIDGPAMAAALAESCQSVILRSPWGRLGRYYTSAIAYAACAAASIGGYICQDASQYISLDHDPPKFWIQSSLESSKLSRTRRRRLPDPRPIPEGVREAIYPRKK